MAKITHLLTNTSNKNRIRYTKQSIENNSYYQLPKFLLDLEFSGLTNDARVLYALLRNRHEMSMKNGWYNKDGEVFIYFKREDMQLILGLSENTITKVMKDLKGYNLIEEQQQGFGKPNKIYLMSSTTHSLGIEGSATTTSELDVMDEIQQPQQARKICGTQTADFTEHEPQSLCFINQKIEIENDININHVKSSQSIEKKEKLDKADAIIQTIEAYKKLIKENIRYDDFIISRKYDLGLINEFISIIIDVVMSKGEYLRINGEDKPRELVKHNLLNLDYSDIDHCIDQFKTITDRISKKKQYIISMLYNCKMELDSHYTNLVNHDKWNS